MTWQPLNLASSVYAAEPEPPYLLGLLYRRMRTGISGAPETLKTLLSLILGLEHMRTTSEGFAFIDFETGPSGIRRLLDDLGATSEEIESVVYFDPDTAPTAEDLVAIDAAGVTFAVIDAAAGAYAVSMLDDNARKDVEQFYGMWVKPLWQRGITTCLLDHVTKNSDTRGKFSIGSERKLGTLDVHLGLTAVKQLHRGGQGVVRIHTHKDRGGFLDRPNVGELHLTSDADTHAITWEFKDAQAEQVKDGSWRPTELMGKVSRYLQQQPEPVSLNQICKDVFGKREYLLQAIDHLITDGHATETKGARNARLITSSRPFPDLFPGTTNDQFPVSPLYRGNGNGSEHEELDRLSTKHADLNGRVT